MARPIYDEKITRETDWGGDASTGGAPVSGRRVQEYIKEEITALDNAKNALVKQQGETAEAVKSVQGEVGDIKTNASDLNKVVAGIQSEVKDITENVSTLSNGLNESKGAIKGLTERMGAAESDVNNLKENVGNINESITTLGSNKADKAIFVVMSDVAYDALEEKDPEKFYYVYED